MTIQENISEWKKDKQQLQIEISKLDTACKEKQSRINELGKILQNEKSRSKRIEQIWADQRKKITQLSEEISSVNSNSKKNDTQKL